MDLKKDQLFLASEYIKKCVNRFHFEVGNFKLLPLRVGTGMCTILFVISKASWKLTILMLGGTSFVSSNQIFNYQLENVESLLYVVLLRQLNPSRFRSSVAKLTLPWKLPKKKTS